MPKRRREEYSETDSEYRHKKKGKKSKHRSHSRRSYSSSDEDYGRNYISSRLLRSYDHLRSSRKSSYRYKSSKKKTSSSKVKYYEYERYYGEPQEPPKKHRKSSKRNKCVCNLFEKGDMERYVLESAQWSIYKYSVSFKPKLEELSQKKKIVKRFSRELGSNFQFDGSMLFSPYKFQKTKLVLKDKKDAVKLKVRFAGRVEAMEWQFANLFNQ